MNKEYSELTAEVTPDIEKIMKETLNLEIEMLQGEREELPNGMIKYTLKIFDDQKSELVKEFCLKMISKSHMTEKN